MTEKLIIKSSRWRFGLLLLGCVVFVVMGLVIIFMKGNWFGLVPIIFFGMGGVVAVWQLVDSRPRLVIDERGVVDRTLGVGRIDWRDVKSAYVASINDNDFICLELRDPEKYRARLSNVRRALAKANLRLGFTDFSLNLSGVAANTHEVYELVLKLSELARREAARESDV
jgi:hypothetical protein